jgi:hypothetical protein
MPITSGFDLPGYLDAHKLFCGWGMLAAATHPNTRSGIICKQIYKKTLPLRKMSKCTQVIHFFNFTPIFW